MQIVYILHEHDLHIHSLRELSRNTYIFKPFNVITFKLTGVCIVYMPHTENSLHLQWLLIVTLYCFLYVQAVPTVRPPVTLCMAAWRTAHLAKTSQHSVWMVSAVSHGYTLRELPERVSEKFKVWQYWGVTAPRARFMDGLMHEHGCVCTCRYQSVCNRSVLCWSELQPVCRALAHTDITGLLRWPNLDHYAYPEPVNCFNSHVLRLSRAAEPQIIKSLAGRGLI